MLVWSLMVGPHSAVSRAACSVTVAVGYYVKQTASSTGVVQLNCSSTTTAKQQQQHSNNIRLRQVGLVTHNITQLTPRLFDNIDTHRQHIDGVTRVKTLTRRQLSRQVFICNRIKKRI